MRVCRKEKFRVQTMKEKSTIFKVASIGVFAALVFVASMISIPIPVAIGDVSRIHLGNIFCLLSGLVLGPVGGGFAAGIGSALYDMMNPVYIASAPFTLLFKFLMAFIAGLVAYSRNNKGHNVPFNILGCALGQIAYIVLYLTKTFVTGILEGNAAGALVPAIITKLGTSSINAVIAIIFAVPLCMAVRTALKKSKLLN